MRRYDKEKGREKGERKLLRYRHFNVKRRLVERPLGSALERVKSVIVDFVATPSGCLWLHL